MGVVTMIGVVVVGVVVRRYRFPHNITYLLLYLY